MSSGAEPQALLVVPLPCDAVTFFAMASAAAKRWEADHLGRKMTMGHLETRRTEFGESVIMWDAPVEGLS